MSDSTPLTGIALVDCAKANATETVEVAAERCGFGADIDSFRTALISACNDIGVAIDTLTDLITDQRQVMYEGGIEVAPDTPGKL
ncbi:MAG: hypothetical protein ACFB0E_06720 [Leptolyngbyaceae cyanobacterium]